MPIVTICIAGVATESNSVDVNAADNNILCSMLELQKAAIIDSAQTYNGSSKRPIYLYREDNP